MRLVERVERYFAKDPPLIGRDAVEALFTLGQYLVYLNLCELDAGLGLSRKECPARVKP